MSSEREPVGHLHSNGDFCQERNVQSATWPVPLYQRDPDYWRNHANANIVAPPAAREAEMQAEIEELKRDRDSWYQQHQDRIDDALKAFKERDEALEKAAQLAEGMTLRARQTRAWGDASPVEPCEIAAAIRALTKENV